MGIYTALFGIASQRYENTADRIELRANALVTLLVNNDSRISATGQVFEVQYMRCPLKPEFSDPSSVFQSFFGTEDIYKPGSDLLAKTLESIKMKLGSPERLSHKETFSKGDFFDQNTRTNLNGANLIGVNLSGADLQNCNLIGTKLNGANLSGANLAGSNLQGADLTDALLPEANFTGSNLTGANLKGALLPGAKLIRANLEFAELEGANLSFANLKEARLVGADLTGVNLMHSNLQDLNGFRGCSWKYANIYLVKQPPEKFLGWVRDPNQGAVEMDFNTWKKFKENGYKKLE